jgi:hypothetical protein
MFMPWANVKDDLTIGPFNVWPWNKSRVSDSAIADHLDKYFKTHVDHYGRRVSSITMLSADDTFAPVSGRQMDNARLAVDCLLLAEVYPDVKAAVQNDDRSMAPPTADRYQLVTQRFVPGDSSFAVNVGGSVHAGEIGKLRVTCPWDQGGNSFPNDELLQGLSGLFARKAKAADRQRIARSLEWFRHAHTSGDGSSALTKVVMMATAFEILFSLPRHQKTAAFISEVRRRLDRAKTRTKTDTDSIGKARTYSLPGWWADDFYDLRSRVVHGDAIKASRMKYKGWLTHLIVADVVFGQCLWSELYDLKLVGKDTRKLSKQYDRLCPGQPKGWNEQRLKDWLNGDTKTHERLGWLPKARR